MEPVTEACALTRNQKGILSVPRTALQPTEPHGPGKLSHSFLCCSASSSLLLSGILFLHSTRLSVIPSFFAHYQFNWFFIFSFCPVLHKLGGLSPPWPEVDVVCGISPQEKGIFPPSRANPGKHTCYLEAVWFLHRGWACGTFRYISVPRRASSSTADCGLHTYHTFHLFSNLHPFCSIIHPSADIACYLSMSI